MPQVLYKKDDDLMANHRLTNEEYENLSVLYEQEPPTLSGKPGFLTTMREQQLIAELLPQDYVRFINVKAKSMLMSPSEAIQYAIKEQLTKVD